MSSDKTLKKVLKLLKEYETTLSMVMGGLVVIIAAYLLISVIRSGKSSSPSQEVPPTVTADNILVTPDLRIVNKEETKVASETSLWTKAGSLIKRIFQPTSETETTVTEPGITPETYTLKLIRQANGNIMTEQLPKTHTVSKDETLWKIAEKYYGSGYNWVDIAITNKLNKRGEVKEGQTLSLPQVRVRVPKYGKLLAEVIDQTNQVSTTNTSLLGEVNRTSYTVVKGDCLWSIAIKTYQDGYKWTQIWEANKDQIKKPQIIEVGWVLRIP